LRAGRRVHAEAKGKEDLLAGEVGYVTAGIKELRAAKVAIRSPTTPSPPAKRCRASRK